MDNLRNKIDILNSINTDNSRFIVKVIESFKNKEQKIEIGKINSSIHIKNSEIVLEKNAIDLDKIWAKPYIYTKMRQRLECLVRIVEETKESEISSNPNKFCKKAIFNGAGVKFSKEENQVDIVEFLKDMNTNKCNWDFSKVSFYADVIDEESMFKEVQIKKAITFFEEKNIEKRNSLIYDEICKYLDEDFLSNNYCDFIDNKCIAQRNHAIYPFSKKNGCCFKNFTQCPNLAKGGCTVECMGCKLFACNYLTKMGVGYWAENFILLKLFFSKKQRIHIVFDFYKSKDEVLQKINTIKI